MSGAEKIGGLRYGATGGVIAIALSQVCKIVSQFATLLVLSRMLAPIDFGIVAMIMPIVGIIPLLQDFGLQQALVQARDVTHEQASRIFWVNFAIALAMGTFLIASGPLAAAFYGDERVASLLALWAVPVVLTSLAAHHVGVLNRQLRFARIASIEISASIGTAAAAVGGALVFANHLALLASATAGATVSLVLAWNATRWIPRSPRVPARVGHLLRFGAELTAADILNYLSRNVGNVMIAATFGAPKLGLYDLAYKLVLLPISHVNVPLGRVMQPLLGRVRDEGPRYRRAYLLVASALVWALAPLLCALAAASKPFVDLLLGDRWLPIVPILFWLSLAGLCNLLTSTMGWLLISQHRTGERLRMSLVSAAVTIAALFAGLPFGVSGVAAAYALSVLLLQAPIVFHLVGRRGPVGARDLWSIQAPVLLAAAATLGGMSLLEPALPDSDLARATCTVLASYAILSATLAALPDSRRRAGELAVMAAELAGTFIRAKSARYR